MPQLLQNPSQMNVLQHAPRLSWFDHPASCCHELSHDQCCLSLSSCCYSNYWYYCYLLYSCPSGIGWTQVDRHSHSSHPGHHAPSSLIGALCDVGCCQHCRCDHDLDDAVLTFVEETKWCLSRCQCQCHCQWGLAKECDASCFCSC